MKILEFKCETLSDIIINQKSGSEGANKSLDFIPGSNFLGIAASKIYLEPNNKTLDIFHSGKVRFSDAHPLYNNIRSLNVPAAFYCPKNGKLSDNTYVHHKIKNHKALLDLQLKQCRKGFYTFADNTANKICSNFSYTIKSAYNSETKSSKKAAMFGYQSIRAGMTYGFTVELDNGMEVYEDLIIQSLLGTRHIGRSRSAEYGLVKITFDKFDQIRNGNINSNEITVYADGRLIFIDNNGLPLLQPSAKDLHLNGKIKWEKSQIITFAYSPWNFKRRSYDSDRCGIEKGSVFVVELENVSISDLPSYIGAYKSEGFGKVLYNPQFLESAESNGKCRYFFTDAEVCIEESLNDADNELISYLKSEKIRYELNSSAYNLVDVFIKDYKPFFSKEFSSQWGIVRCIASQNANKESIIREIEKFVKNGIMAEQWDHKSRGNDLIKFCNRADVTKETIVNLAVQMGKECK